MALATFHNLPPEKKQQILETLKQIFEDNMFNEVTVSQIVSALAIARGSFYQYFEDLEDCYFTVMAHFTGHVHHKFHELVKASRGDLMQSLADIGLFLQAELFNPETRTLYENYLRVQNSQLMERNPYRHGYHHLIEEIHPLDQTTAHYIAVLIHDISYRTLVLGWSKAEFRQHYHHLLDFIKRGMNETN